MVFRQDGKQTAYYVDEGADYRQVPEFFAQQEKQLCLLYTSATAHELITTIDGHLAQLQQQRQAQQEQPQAAPLEQAAERCV